MLLQTELDSTQSYYHYKYTYLSTTCCYENDESNLLHKLSTEYVFRSSVLPMLMEAQIKWIWQPQFQLIQLTAIRKN